MAKYCIGALIYENRTRQKITQEELCDGICTATTLSKIENGQQLPRRKTFEALVQRLGISEQCCFFPVSDNEMRRSNLEFRITRELSTGNYDILDLLEQYKECGERMGTMEEQFYFQSMAMITLGKGGIYQEARHLLMKSIYLTIPHFSIPMPERYKLLTFDEIRIMNSIAIVEYQIGNTENAITLMFYLKDYMNRNNIDLEEKAKLYPMILYNLSNWMGKERRDELAYTLCEEGIDFCIQNGKLSVFPFLIFNKGYSLARMSRLKEAVPYIRQACTIFEALKDQKRADMCRQEIEQSFSIHL
ncbi:MAG: helix-turn-helix transcriptional regulator [Lachnospiraceae bacterium]|jgi:transcriptional regulator with XRE-family HTH domain|nr:helix-turn-helix transcriptional regulator [Lachnospiraceae bacterium]MCI9151395.1 helix-turn-helix transcriptional regulator [Lachnospiraceae bacterium]